jgi:electron transport complex protein RnfC
MSCIECGTCSFICPGRMHLVQDIRDAKAKLSEINRKQEKKPAI